MRVVRRLLLGGVAAMLVLGAVSVPAGADQSGDPGTEPVEPGRAELAEPVDVPANAQWVRLLTTTVEMERSEVRRVDATAVGAVGDVPDTVLVLHAEVRCGLADGTARRSMVQYVNIWRDRTSALTPGFTYRARTSGTHQCELWVRGGRPRPVTGATGNQLTLLAGSFLVVGSEDSSVVEDFRPRSRSLLVDRKEHPLRTISSVTWSAPAGTDLDEEEVAVAVRGWVSLTSCTSLSGSSDPVQGDKQLCTKRHRSVNGSTVLLRTRIDQLDRRGRPCATTYIGGVDGRYVAVGRELHHSSRSYAATVALRAGCAARLRVTTTLRWRSGASMMVHRQGTILTASPVDVAAAER